MIREGRSSPIDFGMPSTAGNNQIYAAVYKAKSERELLSMLDKLSLKLGGKYKDATDEVISRAAVEAFYHKGTNLGHQDSADRNVMVQIKSAADLVGGGVIKLNDKSQVKIDKGTAQNVYHNLMRLKNNQRGKVLKAMQKSKGGFSKFLKLLNR
jgi:hypothetical protein